jgi:dTDP-glucose pyrophosphorylase
MAGHGKRFTDAGYTASKSLIPVSGKPMIVRAVESMPEADEWVFVVRQEHLDEKEVMDTLKSVASKVTILVDPNPTGQLRSCLVARKFIETDEPIFIGACDFGMIYDENEYLRVLQDPKSRVISWSFTQQPKLENNPTAWGWLKQDDQMMVKGVSVKAPISENPINDYAITGSFTFKSGNEFLKIADELMKRDIRVKGEFYIDSMLDLAIELGYSVTSFPVTYVGWGVPADYEEYLYWEKVFNNPDGHQDVKEKSEYGFWQGIFRNGNFLK